MHHALLASGDPPLAQKTKQIGGQHRVAIAPTLAALNPQQHAFAVDIAHLEMRDLRNAQPCAIGNRQGRVTLEAGCCLEQAGGLVAAEDDRQIAGLVHTHQPVWQIGPVERVGKEKAQGRDDAYSWSTQERRLRDARYGSAAVPPPSPYRVIVPETS